ncbi:hypothetical protein C2S53_007140 [Perilla frutescens var. hirtella]|uniref:Uncharacterized protein n=1 Tax=Perilla frutescens var. hirtella TaxID=608512 RepID=A0AAD4INM4_PERFH|nr:hypothetical protein C2S53_007140 [Perilla frutescens var. hirtella]
MSLLCRAKLSGRIRLSSLYSIASLQQLNSYSTTKTPKSTNPKTQKPPASSWSYSERIKKSTGDVITWPKPSEIPYQAKVANFVKLVGHVNSRVQFETASDGKFFAATVISQEIRGGKNSLSIPVVFEDDLAHAVACHVKENDCVLVSGQLSSEQLRFEMGDGFGKFHVVGENLNFVEGYKRSVSMKKSAGSDLGVGIEISVDGGIGNVDAEEFDQRSKEALEDAKVKSFSNKKDWGSSSVSLEPSIGSEGAMSGFGEAKPAGASGGSAAKKKEGDRISDLWRDLVKNSLLWLDYRDHKAKGLVKEKYPDFKHKGTGDAIWINTAPKWVLPGLGKLEFDTPFTKPKFVQRGGQGKLEFDASVINPTLVQGGDNASVAKPKIVQGGKWCGKDEDSWKDLVDNPNKWWDNRTNKRNPKAPDFKHKETGKGLWVSSSPDWASSSLPPLK